MDGRGFVVRRHSSAWGWWEAVDGRPHPVLRGRVLRYTGYREETAAPLRRRQLPSGEVTLIVSFDEPLQLVSMPDAEALDGSFKSFVAGLHTGPAVTEHVGHQQGIGVGLTPFGAYALLGMPMDLLAGGVLELSTVLGRTGADLEAALAEVRGWAERFALLDRVLVAKMDEGPAPAPEVVWAWRRLCATMGRTPIGELADRIGCSHRHLRMGASDVVSYLVGSIAPVLGGFMVWASARKFSGASAAIFAFTALSAVIALIGSTALSWSASRSCSTWLSGMEPTAPTTGW